jgi:hypothetical protein
VTAVKKSKNYTSLIADSFIELVDFEFLVTHELNEIILKKMLSNRFRMKYHGRRKFNNSNDQKLTLEIIDFHNGFYSEVKADNSQFSGRSVKLHNGFDDCNHLVAWHCLWKKTQENSNRAISLVQGYDRPHCEFHDQTEFRKVLLAATSSAFFDFLTVQDQDNIILVTNLPIGNARYSKGLFP